MWEQPYTVPMACSVRAANRQVRPLSAPAPRWKCRGEPVLETHTVLSGQECTMRYLSISSRPSSGDASTRRTRYFQRAPTVREVLPAYAAGRLDGKPFGGRVGRSRGLGGNPTSWRVERAFVDNKSEQARAYTVPGPVGQPEVGMRREFWSNSEACIYGSSALFRSDRSSASTSRRQAALGYGKKAMT